MSDFQIRSGDPLHDAVRAEDSQLAVAQTLLDLGLSPDLDRMNMAVDEDGKVYRCTDR